MSIVDPHELVPIVITHDMARFTCAGIEQEGIVIHEHYDIRAVNMEEAPIEADDAWARAAQLYADLVPDAVPYIVVVEAQHGRRVEAICKRVLGAIEDSVDDALLPQH